MSTQDNVHQLPEKCGLCGGPDIIYAELDMMVRYRDDPGGVYRVQVKVCVECADFLVVSREHVKDVAPEPPPIPNQGGSTCGCGRPAAVMTAQGPMCGECAF